MVDFRTSLIREKFTIQPADETEDPIIALSNRIVVHLISKDKIDDEIFIIRTQNMHSCARLAAAISKEFFERGTIADRMVPISWKLMWGDVIKGYERDWNPDIWCAIYHKGRKVYHDGKYHPFVDVIEQCDAANKNEYNASVKFAESAFSQAGKKVKITHDSNTALIVSCTDAESKCGIIVRAATGVTTFNYTAKPSEKTKKPIQPYTTLTVAAAFLEGVQLAFQVGLLNKKEEFKMIEKHSDLDRQHKRSTNRLFNLDRAISTYEGNFNVFYRPERPSFGNIVEKAEEFSLKFLRPEIERKLDSGEIDAKDWIL